MARIRNLKPQFFKHAELYDAEHASGLPLRVAYAGLWCVADREGRFKWKPREIKLEVLPYDTVDMSAVLDALVRYGFIFKYKCAGQEYGFIPTFKQHQFINRNEAQSTIPAPSENSNAQSLPDSAPSPVVTPPEIHREYTGGLDTDTDISDTDVQHASRAAPPVEPTSTPPSKPKRQNRTPLPEAFPGDDEMADALAFWRTKGRTDLRCVDEMAKFRAHHTAHGKTMADWPAAWRTWFHNALAFNRVEHANGRHESPLQQSERIARELIREDASDEGANPGPRGVPRIALRPAGNER